MQLLRHLEATSRCLGKAQELDLTFFFISCSRSADFHDSNCAAKLRYICFRGCPLRMRCAKGKSPGMEQKTVNAVTKKFRVARCREFCVHTVAARARAPSIFLLSQRTLYRWKAELNTSPALTVYRLSRKTYFCRSYESLYTDISMHCDVLRKSHDVYSIDVISRLAYSVQYRL